MFFKRKKLIEIDAKVDDLLRITAGQSKMEQDHWNSLEQNQKRNYCSCSSTGKVCVTDQ